MQLNNSFPLHALPQILVRGADDDAIDAFVASSGERGGSQGIVGFEFNHRPDHNARRRQDLLEQRKLRP